MRKIKFQFYFKGDKTPNTQEDYLTSTPVIYELVRIAEKQYGKMVDSATLWVEEKIIGAWGPSSRIAHSEPYKFSKYRA